MKKVLYFIPEFPRLTETFIEREVSKLVERGKLDVTIFSLEEGPGRMSPQLKDKVVYKRLSFFGLLFVLPNIFSSSPKVLEARKLIKQDKTKNYFGKMFLFLKSVGYAKMFSKYGPEHIHAHFLSDPSTIAMAAATILDIPFSVSAHARDVFVDGALVSEKSRRGKFIAVCNENAWRKVIEEANTTKSSGKVRLMFHGVDIDYINNAPALVKDFEEPLILSVARLVEKKGLRYLVEASKILKDRGIAHKVKIAGSGELYEDLIEQINEQGVTDFVEILNEGKGVQNEDVISYLKSATAFVLPNVQTEEGDVDGIPTTVIEAALARIPIVVTGAGSTTDLINQETGILVPQKDPISIATSVERLIFDGQLGQNLKTAAYEKARDMFDLDRNVGELENLLLA